MKDLFAKVALPVLALGLNLSAAEDADAKVKTAASSHTVKKPVVKKSASKSTKDQKTHKEKSKKTTSAPVRSGSCTVEQVQKWTPVELYRNMQTGDVIGDASDANKRAFFSSATKLLVIYITLDLMKKGEIKENARIPIKHRTYESTSGYKQSVDPIPAKIDEAKPREILSAIGIRSSNDGPNALGEFISGNLNNFYKLENDYARRIGMDGNFNSATGFNTPSAVKAHWMTTGSMTKLMMVAYNEFGKDLRSFNKRSETLYGYKKGSDEKIKFKVKSKIQAFDPDYAHHIKELEFMKPGFTCDGGIAGVGVLKIKSIRVAFAYAGYRSFQQRDNDINRKVDAIEGMIERGEITKVDLSPSPIEQVIPPETAQSAEEISTEQAVEASNLNLGGYAGILGGVAAPIGLCMIAYAMKRRILPEKKTPSMQNPFIKANTNNYYSTSTSSPLLSGGSLSFRP